MLEDRNFFTKTIDSTILISNSQKRLDGMATNDRSNSIQFTHSASRSFSSHIDTDSISVFNFFLNDTVKKAAGISSLNYTLYPDQVTINGISKEKDSSSFFERLFHENIPQENTIQNITPSSAKGLVSFTYTNFSKLYAQLRELTAKKNDSLESYELFESASEMGEIYLDSNRAIVLKSIDRTSTIDALVDHQEIINTYRNVDIYDISNDSIFRPMSPLLTNTAINKYTILDDFFVFANSEEVLQTIIASYLNNSTLSNEQSFGNCMNNLSDESSVLLVVNSDLLKEKLEGLFENGINANDIKNYKHSAFQLIQDDQFIHFNGILSKYNKRTISNEILEEFNITLDDHILVPPHFVINHRTRQKEIVVQDVNNNLYLISNRGKILWKKQLNGAILGEIEQVDLYRNGRLQLAFATSKRVYVIDRNGNDVSPFPLRFNDDITQPLSIFDYDRKKNYRFVVVQKGNVLVYDRRGKTVRGFDYNNSGIITSRPKHIRVNSRDYIVFVAGGKMQILNRRGKVRIPSNNSFEHSHNDVFYYKNAFTTTSSNGTLVQVNLNGNFAEQDLNLDNYHLIDATSKTLVSISDNLLNIKQRTYELEFGDYTQPKIFYINDKIYVTISDKQSNRIFMFDSQARLLSNFPVYGNSTVDFENIDSDPKLEFVTIGDSNSIIVYEKN